MMKMLAEKLGMRNRHLYTREGIQPTWTPIKPVTTQFAVGRTKSAQVVRKQFPLCPAAAKTVHTSQGDTQTQIVANLNTKRAIPHIHYVALSRVITMEGLYITDLCTNKIDVDPKVGKKMLELRTQRNFCFTPLYMLNLSDFKICYLNARSLHKHIDDISPEHIIIIAVYCSPQVPLGQLCSALQHIVDQTSNKHIYWRF